MQNRVQGESHAPMGRRHFTELLSSRYWAYTEYGRYQPSVFVSSVRAFIIKYEKEAE